jgi:hypothetical protein
MGGAGNSGQEPGNQTAATGGGTTPLPGWGATTPGTATAPQTGVPTTTIPESLRPYEEISASTGTGPTSGLLAGAPAGAANPESFLPGAQGPLGFNSEDYPVTPGEVPTYGVEPPPPPVTPVDTDPWGGRVQSFGPGTEGFATDTLAQYQQRWPSYLQAEQKPGTETWWLPKGVAR